MLEWQLPQGGQNLYLTLAESPKMDCADIVAPMAGGAGVIGCPGYHST